MPYANEAKEIVHGQWDSEELFAGFELWSYSASGSIRKEFYNRVFALSHKDLWDGGTLVNDNSVKDFLLGGLLSIKNANPHKFIESCTKDANNLFLQRGSVREINALNNKLKTIKRKIHEI